MDQAWRSVEFDQQVAAIVPALGKYARLLTRSGRWQDLVQDTVVRILEKGYLYQKRSGSTFSSWCMCIMHNLHATHTRSWNRKGGDPAELNELVLPPVNPDAEIKVLVSEVSNKLAGLYKEQRRALLYQVLDDMTYGEIARRMQCPVGTVRSRVSRARDQIRAAVD